MHATGRKKKKEKKVQFGEREGEKRVGSNDSGGKMDDS